MRTPETFQNVLGSGKVLLPGECPRETEVFCGGGGECQVVPEPQFPCLNSGQAGIILMPLTKSGAQRLWMWRAWSGSAKPARDPRPKPASLGPSLTCHPHHAPGAALCIGWLQARGPGRPGQGFLAGWGRAGGAGQGRVQPKATSSLLS